MMYLLVLSFYLQHPEYWQSTQQKISGIAHYNARRRHFLLIIQNISINFRSKVLAVDKSVVIRQPITPDSTKSFLPRTKSVDSTSQPIITLNTYLISQSQLSMKFVSQSHHRCLGVLEYHHQLVQVNEDHKVLLYNDWSMETLCKPIRSQLRGQGQTQSVKS